MNVSDIYKSSDIVYARLRYLAIVFFFILPTAICVYVNAKEPSTVSLAKDLDGGVADILTDQSEQQEVFFCTKDFQLEEISLNFGTYGKTASSMLNCEIWDYESRKLLREFDVDTSKLQDNMYENYTIGDPLLLKKGMTYSILVRPAKLTEGDNLALHRSMDKTGQDKSDQNHSFAVINGVSESFDLAISLRGDYQ